MKALQGSSLTPLCSVLISLSVFFTVEYAYTQTENRELRNQELNFLYNKAARYLENKQYSQAIETLESLNSLERNFRDVRSKIALARKRLSEQLLAERVRTDYVKGIAAYEAHDWTNAILAFESILSVTPQYRDTVEKLEDAKTKLVQDNKGSLAIRYYHEGLQAWDRKNFQEAFQFFQKAHELAPGYSNVDQMLAESRAQLTTVTQDLEAGYAKAAASLQAEQWEEGIATLEHLQRLAPHVPEVAGKLAEAKARQLAAMQRQDRTSRRWHVLSLSGVAVTVLTLPLIGLLMFSPVFRAKALAFRGHYGAAADIYDQLLQHKPSRSRLYGKLAELYVLLNRKDKRAMQVYKMVVQLDIPTPKRADIDFVVSQHALGDPDLELAQLPAPGDEKPQGKRLLPTDHLEACLRAIDEFQAPALENALVRAGLDFSHPMLLTQVVMPLMYIIGQRWRIGTLRVEQEHLASATVRTFLGTLIESYTPPADAPRIVVTTPKGHLHELGALAASIVAASEGWQVMYLGPNLPAEEIAAAAKKALASAVALSISWPLGHPDLDKELRKLRTYLGTATAIIAGGRAAESHSATLEEIQAFRVDSKHELLSLRDVLDQVRRT